MKINNQARQSDFIYLDTYQSDQTMKPAPLKMIRHVASENN